MGAMSSKHNDTPETASRAYDVTRDGFVIAGGGGTLVMEELEHAKARGAKIYCERGNHAFPLSELQAAVLAPQLTKLDARNQLRRSNVRWLLDSLRTRSRAISTWLAP